MIKENIETPSDTPSQSNSTNSSTDQSTNNQQLPRILIGEKALSLQHNFWYRGDTRVPSQIFSEGFHARGTDYRVWEHVNTIGTHWNKDSGFVATSESREVAIKFPYKSKKTTRYIYALNPQHNAINVNKVLRSEANKIGIDPEDLTIMLKELEHAVPDKINPKDIQGAWSVTKAHSHGKTQYTIDKSFIPNPNYSVPRWMKVTRSVKPVAKTMTVMQIGLDSVELFNAYLDGIEKNDYSQFFQKTTHTVGGWTGAIYVGNTFGKVAAGYCAPLGPYAALTCGVGGSLVGSALGYMIGSQALSIRDAAALETEKTTPALQSPTQESQTMQSITTFYDTEDDVLNAQLLANVTNPIRKFMQTDFSRLVHGSHSEYSLQQLQNALDNQPGSSAIQSSYSKGKTNFKTQLSAKKTPNPHDTNIIKQKLDHLGVIVDEKLETLIEHHTEIRSQLTKFNQHLQENENRELRRQRQEDRMECVGFVNALGTYCNNKTLCQVSQLALAGARIYQGIEKLSTVSSLMSLSGAASLASIGVGVLMVMSLFSKKKGSDPTQVMSNLIHAFAQQIFAVIHERFDRIEQMLGKLFTTMLSEFCELRIKSNDIKHLLELLRHEILSHQEHVSGSLQTLTDKIHHLSSQIVCSERKRAIQEMYIHTERVLSGYQFSTAEFIDLSGKLRSHILTLDSNDPFLVGRQADKTHCVKSHENEGDNEFSADFNVAELLQEFHALLPQDHRIAINPILWCWQVLMLMQLLQHRYEIKENPTNYIAKAELEKLKPILKMGQGLLKTLKLFKETCFINHLCDQYEAAATRLDSALHEHFIRQEQKITTDLNREWQKMLDITNENILELIQQQKDYITIDPCCNDKNGWFLSSSTHHAKHAKDYCTSPWIQNGYSSRQKEIYKSQQEQVVKEQTQTLVNEVQRFRIENQDLSAGQYKLFLNSTINPKIFQILLRPIDANQPILLLPENYKGEISNTTLEAVWLKLRNLNFNYLIRNNRLIIEYTASQPRTTPLLRSFFIPYNPDIYTSNEAIWKFWYGGHYALGGESVAVCVESGGGCDYWSHTVKLPICRKQIGYRQKIQQCTDVHMLPDPIQNALAESQITNEIHEFKSKKLQEIANKLQRDLNANEVSNLSKVLIEYSYYFYMLQDALQLSCKDDDAMNQLPLQFFSNKVHIINANGAPNLTLLRNRLDLFSLLSNTSDRTSSFCDDLQATQHYFCQQVKPAIQELIETEESQYYLVHEVVQAFEHMLNQYEPIAVDENELISSLSREEQLTEENQLHRIILKAVANTVATLDPQTQQQFLETLKADLSRTRIQSGYNVLRLFTAPQNLQPHSDSEDEIHEETAIPHR